MGSATGVGGLATVIRGRPRFTQDVDLIVDIPQLVLPGLLDELAKHGFDPQMGARPMARLIQDTIRRSLADELLFGRLANGGKVTIDIDSEDKVVLRFAEEPAPLEPAT